MAKTRKPFFERLKTGLEERIAHAKGDLTLKTVELPEVPPEIDAPEMVCQVVGLRSVRLHGFKILPIGNGKRRIVWDRK